MPQLLCRAHRLARRLSALWAAILALLITAIGCHDSQNNSKPGSPTRWSGVDSGFNAASIRRHFTAVRVSHKLERVR